MRMAELMGHSPRPFPQHLSVLSSCLCSQPCARPVSSLGRCSRPPARKEVQLSFPKLHSPHRPVHSPGPAVQMSTVLVTEGRDLGTHASGSVTDLESA